MQLIVSHSTVRNINTGGLITFKKWADLAGIDTSDKAQRKLAMKRYDDEKRSVITDNHRVLAAASTDARYAVKKFNIKTDKDGNVIGYDASARVPSKAEVKAAAKAVETDTIAKLQAELAQLKAALADNLANLTANN